MESPPKITEVPAREIPIEVLPPESSQSSARTPTSEGPPIHALSALVLVAVDSLWAVFDLAPLIGIIAIPLCFVTGFVPSFLIQKHLHPDSNGRALALASLLAALSASPNPITVTPHGV